MQTYKPQPDEECEQPLPTYETFTMQNSATIFSSPDLLDFITSVELIPEKYLLAAILERSYFDLISNVDPKDRREAVAWFESKEIDTHDESFPYLYIKEALDLNERHERIIEKAITYAKGRKINGELDSERKEDREICCRLAQKPRRKVSPAYRAVLR